MLGGNRGKMSTYRRYRATYTYVARDQYELTVYPGDLILVRTTTRGEWPTNDDRWMWGKNEASTCEGNFLLTHVELVEEFTVYPQEEQNGVVRQKPSSMMTQSLGHHHSSAQQQQQQRLAEQEWYWGRISREDVALKLSGAPDGSYLVRDSASTPGEYVLTMKERSADVLIKILFVNGKYGLAEPTVFDTVPALISYYGYTPPIKSNPYVTLCHPVSRFSKTLQPQSSRPLPPPLDIRPRETPPNMTHHHQHHQNQHPGSIWSSSNSSSIWSPNSIMSPATPTSIGTPTSAMTPSVLSRHPSVQSRGNERCNGHEPMKRVDKEKEKERKKREEMRLKNRSKGLKTYKQFNLPSDVKHLFAAEVLLDHPKTKSHLNVTTGEVVFILLLSHPKLPYEKYLAEKEDGSIGFVNKNITQRTVYTQLPQDPIR